MYRVAVFLLAVFFSNGTFGSSLHIPELFRFIDILPRCFTSGVATSYSFDDEGDKRLCTDEFKASTIPITVGMFRAFVSNTGYLTDAERNEGPVNGCWIYGTKGGRYDKNANWKSPGFLQSDSHPVVCVSKNDADAYGKWLTNNLPGEYRLPTESQLAALSSRYLSIELNSSNICKFGNSLDANTSFELGKFSDITCLDGHKYTSQVASYPPSSDGIFDLIGNIWELTCSEYSRNWIGSEQTCTTKPDVFISRRGGGWIDSFRSSRPFTRYRGFPYLRYNFLGFRLVKN